MVEVVFAHYKGGFYKDHGLEFLSDILDIVQRELVRPGTPANKALRYYKLEEYARSSSEPASPTFAWLGACVMAVMKGKLV